MQEQSGKAQVLREGSLGGEALKGGGAMGRWEDGRRGKERKMGQEEMEGWEKGRKGEMGEGKMAGGETGRRRKMQDLFYCQILLSTF